MKVKELIRRLAVCNQEALLYVYDDQGEPEELNTITVGNNNDDIAMDYHLYHLNESENNISSVGELMELKKMIR